MPIYKHSKEEFSQESPQSRFGKLKWWFLLLIVVGVLAFAYVVVLQGQKTVEHLKTSETTMSPVSVAFAQEPGNSGADAFTPRVIIVSGVFLVLGIVYIAGIVKLFFTRNADQVDAASDLVKTLTGFFVGAATGFLG
jgi:hypothetical protein